MCTPSNFPRLGKHFAEPNPTSWLNYSAYTECQRVECCQIPYSPFFLSLLNVTHAHMHMCAPLGKPSHATQGVITGSRHHMLSSSVAMISHSAWAGFLCDCTTVGRCFMHVVSSLCESMHMNLASCAKNLKFKF